LAGNRYCLALIIWLVIVHLNVDLLSYLPWMACINMPAAEHNLKLTLLVQKWKKFTIKRSNRIFCWVCEHAIS